MKHLIPLKINLHCFWQKKESTWDIWWISKSKLSSLKLGKGNMLLMLYLNIFGWAPIQVLSLLPFGWGAHFSWFWGILSVQGAFCHLGEELISPDFEGFYQYKEPKKRGRKFLCSQNGKEPNTAIEILKPSCINNSYGILLWGSFCSLICLFF